MPLEREVLPDQSEARQECLRALRVTKAAHATLAFACRLAVFSSVVQSGCRFDKHVPYARQLWNLSFGRRIAAQLIGDDLMRHRDRAQHTLEEAFGSGLVAPLLQQDVEFGTVLVHCAP
jgi:GAF domain-containing protein